MHRTAEICFSVEALRSQINVRSSNRIRYRKPRIDCIWSHFSSGYLFKLAGLRFIRTFLYQFESRDYYGSVINERGRRRNWIESSFLRSWNRGSNSDGALLMPFLGHVRCPRADKCSYDAIYDFNNETALMPVLESGDLMRYCPKKTSNDHCRYNTIKKHLMTFLIEKNSMALYIHFAFCYSAMNHEITIITYKWSTVNSLHCCSNSAHVHFQNCHICKCLVMRLFIIIDVFWLSLCLHKLPSCIFFLKITHTNYFAKFWWKILSYF